jgi:hypothetical protein
VFVSKKDWTWPPTGYVRMCSSSFSSTLLVVCIQWGYALRVKIWLVSFLTCNYFLVIWSLLNNVQHAYTSIFIHIYKTISAEKNEICIHIVAKMVQSFIILLISRCGSLFSPTIRTLRIDVYIFCWFLQVRLGATNFLLPI